jgi:hypothetical protein
MAQPLATCGIKVDQPTCRIPGPQCTVRSSTNHRPQPRIRLAIGHAGPDDPNRTLVLSDSEDWLDLERPDEHPVSACVLGIATGRPAASVCMRARLSFCRAPLPDTCYGACFRRRQQPALGSAWISTAKA